MNRRGEKPTRIHNNCSGKQTGFLTVARHWDIATAGYEHFEHPVQQAVAAALRYLSGVADLPWGIDGCAAPNFALPLSGECLKSVTGRSELVLHPWACSKRLRNGALVPDRDPRSLGNAH